MAHPLFALGLPHGADWLYLFFFVLIFGPVIWVWALISCVKNESANDNTKVVWVLLIVFLHFFGAAAYLLWRRPRRLRELGR
jgi:hypothetical protein